MENEFPTNRTTLYEDEHGDLWRLNFEVDKSGHVDITGVTRLAKPVDLRTLPAYLVSEFLGHVNTVATKL